MFSLALRTFAEVSASGFGSGSSANDEIFLAAVFGVRSPRGGPLEVLFGGPPGPRPGGTLEGPEESLFGGPLGLLLAGLPVGPLRTVAGAARC